MNILLAARHSPKSVRKIGGVQSWCATVANELEKRGHTVSFWALDVAVENSSVFDLGIFANAKDTEPALPFAKRHVFVSHGIIEPERPPSLNTVFTSEEVRQHWSGTGPIVRQPIDMEFWTPDLNAKKTYLTRFSYYGGLPFLSSLAEKMRMPFQHLATASHALARSIIQQSACVLASGRAALEAMACGIPVVVCDHRNMYQDAFMDTDLSRAMKHNYSGRGGVTPTPDLIMDAVSKAIVKGSLIGHIKEHHDAKRVVDRLMEYAT